jgi:hypothetical protein
MKITNKQEVILYESIIDSFELINAWKSVELLPIPDGSKEDIDNLKKLMAIEVVFNGTMGDKSKIDPLFETVNLWVNGILQKLNMQAYLFTSDFKAQLPTRIRTYKGILPQSLKDSNYCEFELLPPEKYSVIGTLISLNEKNNLEPSAFDIFTDSATSFITISANPEFLTPKTIENILSKYMIHKSRSQLNYLKLITRYCLQGDIILRIGGDGGDRYVSIQIFCLKSTKELVLNAFK